MCLLVRCACAVVFMAAAQHVCGLELRMQASTGNVLSTGVPRTFAVGTVVDITAEATTTPQGIWLIETMSLHVELLFSADDLVSPRADTLTLQIEEERSPYVPVSDDWQKFKRLERGTEVLVLLHPNREGHLSFVPGEIFPVNQSHGYHTALKQKCPSLYQLFMRHVWLERLRLGTCGIATLGAVLWIGWLLRSWKQHLKQ